MFISLQTPRAKNGTFNEPEPKNPPQVCSVKKRWLQVDQSDLRFACTWWWKMVTNSSHGTIPIRKNIHHPHPKRKQIQGTGNSTWSSSPHWIDLQNPDGMWRWFQPSPVGSINQSWGPHLVENVFRFFGDADFSCPKKYIYLKKTEALRGDSKCPFNPLVGGHLTIPKRSLWITRYVSLSFFLCLLPLLKPDPKRPNLPAALWRGPLRFPW